MVALHALHLKLGIVMLTARIIGTRTRLAIRQQGNNHDLLLLLHLVKLLVIVRMVIYLEVLSAPHQKTDLVLLIVCRHLHRGNRVTKILENREEM